MTGLLVIAVAVVVVLGFGAWRGYADGRFRGTRGITAAHVDSTPDTAVDAGSVLDQTPYADGLGERATLLQFSSAFCAPCRATRRTLAEVAVLVPGVAHIEVDAEQHLDLVRRVGIVRTPTTLVLDSAGHEVSRAAGAPGKAAVIGSLGWLATEDLDIRDERP